MMWDKKEAERGNPQSAPAPSRPEPHPAAPSSPGVALAARGRAANIGTSLFIKGEVSGSEDLTVEGRVEGRIDLKDHNLTIAQSGRVSAEIHAKNVTIVGEVTGNIQADEKVELAETGRLVGDIQAPRIAISDGAQLRGSVDMTRERAISPAAGMKDRIPGPVQVTGKLVGQA